MQLNTTPLDNAGLEIVLQGRIDASNAMDFQKEALELLNADLKYILVNFSDLDYISSAGLRAILMLAKTTKSKQQQLICFKTCCL